MISFEIVYDKDKVIDYVEDWNRLFDAGIYEASTSFEWTRALLATHLNKDRFVLIIIKDRNEIVGILPLVISESKKQGISLLYLYHISEYYDTHSDLLFKDQTEEFISIFITALFEHEYKWDVFRMSRFVEGNPVLSQIENYLKKTSIRYQINGEEPSFYVHLETTYNDYLMKRSSKFRNYLRRMEKKTKSAGTVEIVKTESANINEAYKNVLYIEKNSWKHTHGTAITVSDKQQEFYRILCEGACQRGWLHLLIYYFNNEPVAYDMGLIKNNKYSYIKTSYHEAYKKISPSTILRAKLIEGLINDGIEEFDFPGEPYEWEKQWADETRWHKSLLIYNHTYKARLFSLYNSIRKRAEHTKGEFQYHNPKDIKPQL